MSGCDGPGVLEQNIYLEDTLEIIVRDTIYKEKRVEIEKRDSIYFTDLPYEYDIILDTLNNPPSDTLRLIYKDTTMDIILFREGAIGGKQIVSVVEDPNRTMTQFREGNEVQFVFPILILFNDNSQQATSIQVSMSYDDILKEAVSEITDFYSIESIEYSIAWTAQTNHSSYMLRSHAQQGNIPVLNYQDVPTRLIKRTIQGQTGADLITEMWYDGQFTLILSSLFLEIDNNIYRNDPFNEDTIAGQHFVQLLYESVNASTRNLPKMAIKLDGQTSNNINFMQLFPPSQNANVDFIVSYSDTQNNEMPDAMSVNLWIEDSAIMSYTTPDFIVVDEQLMLRIKLNYVRG